MAKKWEQYMGAEYEEISAMGEQELKTLLRSTIIEANKRWRELEKFGYNVYSEAYQAQKTRMGDSYKKGNTPFKADFSVSAPKLRKQVLRNMGFLKAPTSTIPGAEKRRQELIDLFGTDDPAQITPFFELYHKLVDYDPHGTGSTSALSRYAPTVLYSSLRRIIWANRDKPVEQIIEAVEKEYEAAMQGVRDIGW